MTISKTTMTTREVAARFNELARQEKWFEIQGEFFSDNEGKIAVRKKGEDWVKRIEAVHRTYTTEPIVSGNHFAFGREVDLTVQGFGRIKMDEIMLYEVKNGQIVSEQFLY